MNGRLIITPGDPEGIGPEVTVAALRSLGIAATVVGDLRALERAGIATLSAQGVACVSPPLSSEPVEVVAIRFAVAECLAGRASALVTGPIHKARLAARGFAYHGHTDFLGALCNVDEPVMAFVGGGVRVALVTVHEPLSRVPGLITRERVVRVIRECDVSLRRFLDIRRPRIAVCGLNPHAGEAGLLGSEEIDHIAPAVAEARAAGIDANGPISAETAFTSPGISDIIIAMYHDQGLVPLKRVDFGRTVNWTLGLPIVRTSVDHGTADDLVGTGRARSDSMEAAIRLAIQLSAHRTEQSSALP